MERRETIEEVVARLWRAEQELADLMAVFLAASPKEVEDEAAEPDCAACGVHAPGAADPTWPLCGDCEEAGHEDLATEVILRDDESRPVLVGVRTEGTTVDLGISPHPSHTRNVSQVRLEVCAEGVVVTVWSDGEFVAEHTLAAYGGEELAAGVALGRG